MRFGYYLAKAIQQAGFSQREFAIKMRTPQQNMNEIVLGKRGPPLRKLNAWAEALAPHVERERFLVLAWLEHTPDELRELMLRTPGEVERLVEALKPQ